MAAADKAIALGTVNTPCCRRWPFESAPTGRSALSSWSHLSGPDPSATNASEIESAARLCERREWAGPAG